MTEIERKIISRPQHNWLGLVVTIVIPTMILSRLSDSLGPIRTLLLALVWPLLWGGYELYLVKEANFLAAIGTVGVLLTGGIGLLQLEAKWLAVKEAAVPLTIALAIVVLARTKYSLVDTMVRQIIDVERVRSRLTTDAAVKSYQQMMRRMTGFVAASFLLSAILNYTLATWLVKSVAGTESFNHELARLTRIRQLEKVTETTS